MSAVPSKADKPEPTRMAQNGSAEADSHHRFPITFRNFRRREYNRTGAQVYGGSHLAAPF